MIGPDLVSTHIRSKPPSTELWTISVIPIINQDLEAL
jgi:hypothetical protein